MLHHTSVSNCFYYVVTIASSVITDHLICIEYLCFFFNLNQHPSMKDVGCQTYTTVSSGGLRPFGAPGQ